MKKILVFSAVVISYGVYGSEKICRGVAVSPSESAQCFRTSSALELEVQGETGESTFVIDGTPESRCVSLSPGGRQVVMLTDGEEYPQVVHRFDTKVDRCDRFSLTPVNRALFEVVALCNGGREIVGGMWGLPICFYDLERGKVSSKFQKDGHTQSLAVSGNGELVVQGRFNSSDLVAIWDKRDITRRCWRSKKEGPRNAWSVTLSPDGYSVGAVTHNNIIRVWDRRKDEVLFSAGLGNATYTAIAFTADGSRIRSCSENGVGELSLTAE